MAEQSTHDVVVVGASAGGVKTFEAILSGLPTSLAAAVFVAVHSHPSSRYLVDALAAHSALPVAYAVHGERVARGRVYVAPPDSHLKVRPGHVEVVRGPRENGHRPSVDVLFRTAAKAYGARVIGVVLSGYQDCGTAGLLSIKARGGLAVVQAPADAHAPEMPQSAMAHARVDHVAPAAEIAALLTKLVKEHAPAAPQKVDEEILELEGSAKAIGTDLACPVCSGGLSETDLGDFHSFRCHVGHSFSLATLAQMHEDEVERALWSAVRALEDGANLSQRLAGDANGELRERFADRAHVQLRDAEVIRGLLVGSSKR